MMDFFQKSIWSCATTSGEVEAFAPKGGPLGSDLFEAISENTLKPIILLYWAGNCWTWVTSSRFFRCFGI